MVSGVRASIAVAAALDVALMGALGAVAGCATVPTEAVVCDDTADPDCAPAQEIEVE